MAAHSAPLVMGTAGHIDHGKTALVRALTGIDTDRLREEKKRGITIELGFAHLDLAPDLRVSVVDVPGHEKFVKNMVAGASGIDFVLLVVAADEGVMPQTREHLEICQLLGVGAGLVAITKADLVDEELLELAMDDVRGALAGTFLEDSVMIPVSSHTGQGLDELRGAIADLIKDYIPERRSDLARLPVDRVFTMKGHGTVVTGTLVSGEFVLGDEVVLFPTGTRTKIRGLQSHSESVERAPAGRRTAVNLAGLEVEDIERGEILARPGTLFPSNAWDLEITCLSSSPRPLRHRAEVHFHHGSSERMARLYFFDRDVLEPGDTALCQVRFPEPESAVFADRFVVRSFAPLRTVAGGRVVNPFGKRVRRREEDLEAVRKLAGATGEELVEAQLDRSGASGLSFAELMAATNMESRNLDKALQALSGRRKALLFDKEERRYASQHTTETLWEKAAAFLAAFHKKEPAAAGVSRGALTQAMGSKVPAKLAHVIVERALKDGLVEQEQDRLRLPGHTATLAADLEAVREGMAQRFAAAGLTPPNLKDVLDELGVPAKEANTVLGMLTDGGTLVKVKEDMYFDAQAIAALIGSVREYFDTHDELGLAEFKDLTNLTRKYLIPLLEYLDKEKVTVRVGDKRQLRRR
ncbi:selenocysteine-specific translation elongation factor [Oceanidesulfovibrio marinus]|uniref:Selenocysteine-specific elongation factor n=1 Tax=Oceanidesulfovibrio marinus TaxID=370038 RepID=A0A6P1ZIN4_9BACT|nr:selenocysteine-specific translation elongation factor [Oceanidesulfovibrio marinus]QJT09405.1 selenocysteine-specific translation elongation factor [Oceanidesulfovibrio marinus]TVM33634.1 selenocysteine-specific translation elongation factor [Oceanidesulfovibrio marinus]